MTLRFLLDSNVLSEPIKSHPNERMLERLAEHDGELATCSVVRHELSYGAARLAASRKRRAIEAYLEEAVRSTLPILRHDEEAATWQPRSGPAFPGFGQVRARAGGREELIVAPLSCTQLAAWYDWLPWRDRRLGAQLPITELVERELDALVSKAR